MSFHYNKDRNHSQGESFWTSNSDLFLGLSSIFLLLYVVSSLRSGADGVNNATENKKLRIEVQDLQNQLKTYESVKDQYLEQQANKSEKDEYMELMDKLTLLQEESKNEKDSLTQQARENEKKEMALNKYQKMVRNIINSNKLQKTKVTNRNEVIDEQVETIDEQSTKITTLNKDISQKETLIKQKENQISSINNNLAEKVSELKKSYKRAKVSQNVYQSRLKKLQSEARQQITLVEQQKRQTISELNQAKSELSSTQSQLSETQNALEDTKGQLQQKGEEVAGLSNKLNTAKQEAKAKMDALQAKYNADQERERQAFGAALRNQKNLSEGEIARREAQFKAAAAEKDRQFAEQLGRHNAGQERERQAFEAALRNQKNLSEGEIARREAQFKAAAAEKDRQFSGQLSGLAGQFKAAQAEKERQFAGQLSGLAGQLKNTEGQLKNTEGQLNAVKAELADRKKIAQEIKSGFDKIGVKADIDLQSGDVLLDFGQTFFENDSSQLKDEMRKILKKAMPVYSKSLFGNVNVAEKISSVEVIGFASPTYRGKFVDPNSSKPDDIDAMKYNMDLSYKRAKSIFNYILDDKEMAFEHKNSLVPNLTVSGRSFLELMKMNRSVASAEDYCKKNDCKKSQRVIIKFSMNRKK